MGGEAVRLVIEIVVERFELKRRPKTLDVTCRMYKWRDFSVSCSLGALPNG